MDKHRRLRTKIGIWRLVKLDIISMQKFSNKGENSYGYEQYKGNFI